MALETATRKMILPVWKDLSAEEVAQLMSTLADRVAVNAAVGLDVVGQGDQVGGGWRRTSEHAIEVRSNQGEDGQNDGRVEGAEGCGPVAVFAHE